MHHSSPILLALGLAACTPDAGKTDEGATDAVDTDTDTTDTTDTDTTDTDTDTGTSTPTTPVDRPTRFEVVCDPTSNALRFLCTVDVEPAQPVQLTFSRVDGLGATRTVDGDDVSTQHQLPLYFMAPDQDYAVTVIPTAWPDAGIATAVTTRTPPQEVASQLAMTGASTIGMIGSHLPCSGDAVATVYDTSTGDLLWYELMDPNGGFGLLDMVSFTEDHTVLGESRGDVIEVDLMGNDVIRLNDLDTAFGVTAGGLFGNFHHDIMKRNDAYYVFYQESYSGGFFPDVLDVVIIFDGSGTELARWFPIDHLPMPGNWSGDFLHTNTIFVDEDGDFLLSFLTQNTVAKIDGDWTSATFGTPRWILRGTNTGQLGNTITTDWSAVGTPSSFEDQHCVSIRPDGRLQLLDNWNGRSLVITVDEANSAATVDAAYDTREDRCGPQGTAYGTLGGNTLVGCSGDWVREYDGTSGALLWEAEVQCVNSAPFSSGSARWYPLDGW